MWVSYFDREHSRIISEHNENQPEDRWESFSWVVGYYNPDGTFQRWDMLHSKWEAEEKVHYLNGGCIKRCEQ